MQSTARIAILGIYNSGSTALAGALHRLGVDMGAPFWRDPDDHSPNNFYETWDLACLLRTWFPHREEHLQRRLWDAVEAFYTRQTHLRVEYQRLQSEPAAVLRDIAAYAHLTPTESQIAAAAAFIH